MNDPISNTFIERWGLPGAIIVVMAGVIVFLYRELKAERAENARVRDLLLQKAEDYATKVLELSNQVLTTVGQLNDLFAKKRD